MLAILYAQAETSPDWANIAQYGVLGMVVLAFIFGKIVPGYIYERRVIEHEAEKNENRRLEDTIKERVIPALVKSTDVMVQVLDTLNTLEQLQQQQSGPAPRRRAP